VSPALWRPSFLGPNIAMPVGDRPRKAADSRVGTAALPQSINFIRMYLQELELYDFRPDLARVKGRKTERNERGPKTGTRLNVNNRNGPCYQGHLDKVFAVAFSR